MEENARGKEGEWDERRNECDICSVILFDMQGTVVAVLRGGPSNEHDVSLRSGHSVLRNLSRERFTPRDIFIDKQGVWHERGLPTSPERILPTVDVVIAPLHGPYGEGGGIQRLLEQFGVPYTGADSFHSYVSMHKVLSKERAREAGLLTAKYAYIEPSTDVTSALTEVNRTFLQPVVVKPVSWGSSVGVSMTHGYAPTRQAVEALLAEGAQGVLVEERISGTEATVGVVDDFRGEKFYALPPMEIVPPASKEFFNFDAKYSGETREICPGRFTKKDTEELMRAARLMHEALNQRHYSRSDFIVSKRGIYYLETNNASAVGMTEESLFPKLLSATGVKLGDFLSHIIDLAMIKKS